MHQYIVVQWEPRAHSTLLRRTCLTDNFIIQGKLAGKTLRKIQYVNQNVVHIFRHELTQTYNWECNEFHYYCLAVICFSFSYFFTRPLKCVINAKNVRKDKHVHFRIYNIKISYRLSELIKIFKNSLFKFISPTWNWIWIKYSPMFKCNQLF